MAYNHMRTVRETLVYSGTSMLEFANRRKLDPENVDAGLVSLASVQEDTGVPYEKMDELGRN